jgi:hypothetical protein
MRNYSHSGCNAIPPRRLQIQQIHHNPPGRYNRPTSWGKWVKSIKPDLVNWRGAAILVCREDYSLMTDRGSDWVVLALGYRLALGVATSIFFALHRSMHSNATHP